MKAKPIINESNFPKVPSKQALFIVRPKPSQPRLQQQPGTRQARTPTASQSSQKSIDECIGYLEMQISQVQMMSQGACLRIRQHLLALRLKYNSEQQSYNQNRNTLEIPQTLARKQSSKFFKAQKCDNLDQFRNKENAHSTESLFTQKMTRGKSNKEEHQIQIQSLELKLKHLSNRMEEYEKEQHTLGLKIRMLENDLERETKEKIEIKKVFSEDMKKKEESECILRRSLENLEKKLSHVQNQHKAAVQRLRQRESEIVTLWQLLSK